ncbi:MmcQ/YjbR family DNA-binding protein [Cohnella pontilimi]|uniref:MmcQ/YjbR family DNA-binding protein n=1 Tax=Cohnella pontilimi TaxID=2564100 RepID=A0A4U0FG12_9BACL|nr:MmcQ/YjbR family DNA-binding protein [Cohnella pontilimi]TJY43847.1 MmcQ/YjbR family DNA-binding protein [Cohnella pontilimi]
MMKISEVRKIALSLPKTEEVQHWGKPSFRINNKIFTVIQDDMKTVTVKTTKEEREIYTRMDPSTYTIPEAFSNLNYMNINLETANEDEVKELIRIAWKNVAPKNLSKTYFAR